MVVDERVYLIVPHATDQVLDDRFVLRDDILRVGYDNPRCLLVERFIPLFLLFCNPLRMTMLIDRLLDHVLRSPQLFRNLPVLVPFIAEDFYLVICDFRNLNHLLSIVGEIQTDHLHHVVYLNNLSRNGLLDIMEGGVYLNERR